MRRQVDVMITDEGRDKGKVFKITEQSAADAEWWAVRFLLALGKSGVDLPGDPMTMGMQGLAIVGFQALFKIAPYDAKPLLDEMLACIQVYPNPNDRNIVRGLIGEGDIEEVTTLAKLRLEVFTLHTGFSLPAIPSTTSASGTAATA